jgi:hypothetical protein
MDTLLAIAMGRANRHRELMVFDWDKAAQIMRERGAKNASAGLSGDWGHTGGPILSDGKPVTKDDTYTYLASTWATSEPEIDGDITDCYRMQSATPGWDSDTYWPDSALAIVRKTPSDAARPPPTCGPSAIPSMMSEVRAGRRGSPICSVGITAPSGGSSTASRRSPRATSLRFSKRWKIDRARHFWGRKRGGLPPSEVP